MPSTTSDLAPGTGERSRLEGLLVGGTMPGNSSAPIASALIRGVGLGSTETTDRIGKTRSVAEGLIAPNGESALEEGEGPSTNCGSGRVGRHGVRLGSGPLTRCP